MSKDSGSNDGRLTRRGMLKGSAAVVAGGLSTLSCAPGGSSASASASAARRPNILVIVTDDQPRQTDWPMRKIRKWLVDNGVEFTHGHATTPLCAPARSSIFSGRYAHNHGVRDNDHAHNLDQSTTIQAYLKRSGYRTGYFGKYLNSWKLVDNPPNFEEWALSAPRYLDGNFNVNGSVQTISGYSTHVIRDKTLAFLDKAATDSRPWFAYVAPYAPHAPCTPEEKYADIDVPGWDGRPSVFEFDRSGKPAYVRDATHTLHDGRAERDRQLRTLLSVDDAVQAIHDKLATLGQLDDTLVIYIGDNGFYWADHGLVGKEAPYRHAHEVPFYVSWPAGGLSGGRKDDRIVANIDIAPTVLAAAGVTPTIEPDGTSLLSSVSRDHILTEWWRRDGRSDKDTWASYVSKERQYVEYYDLYTDEAGNEVGTGRVTFREYYDLVDDPCQLDNKLHRATPADEHELGIGLLSSRLADDRNS